MGPPSSIPHRERRRGRIVGLNESDLTTTPQVSALSGESTRSRRPAPCKRRLRHGTGGPPRDAASPPPTTGLVRATATFLPPPLTICECSAEGKCTSTEMDVLPPVPPKDGVSLPGRARRNSDRHRASTREEESGLRGQNRADLEPRTERTSHPEQSGLRALNRADFADGGGRRASEWRVSLAGQREFRCSWTGMSMVGRSRTACWTARDTARGTRSSNTPGMM